MNNRTPFFHHTRRAAMIAILTAVTGLYISLRIYTNIAKTEISQARITAETLQQHVYRELLQFVEVLESVRALHALSDNIDQAAMTEFIEKGLIHQHAVLGTFGLAQKIPHSLRAGIEEKDLDAPGAYDIVQSGPQQTWIPAPTKSIYYPLTWQSNPNALNIPVGLDFSAVPEALQTIQKIEKTRLTAVVPRKNLFSQDHAYWVFTPVISSPSQTEFPYLNPPVLGLAVAKLNPDLIVRNIAARSPSVPALMLDIKTPSDLLHKNDIHRTSTGWNYSQSFEFIGAQWSFTCDLPVKASDRRSIISLLLGLTITTLMTSQLLLLGNRTRRIAQEVKLRTEELNEANTQLAESLHERAVMEEMIHERAAIERRRIGRDMHDSLGQKLTGAVFLSRALLNHIDPNDVEQKKHALTLNETLKEAVAQGRRMARGLAPIAMNEDSLRDILQQLTEEMHELYDVKCTLDDCADLPTLSHKTKEQLYLIAREAVNNAARHAKADQIRVQLTGTESAWTLQVQDDGIGFSPDLPADGMGTRIMRHRANMIHVKLSVRSAPNQGTTIKVTNQP